MITIDVTRKMLKKLEEALDDAEKKNQKVKITIMFDKKSIGISKGFF